MSGSGNITYAVDFRAGRQDREEHQNSPAGPPAGEAIPRIARLMALALRFEKLLREEAIRDYAELAKLGQVTRARMTQIMKLLDLAPDIQEQLLFLAPIPGLNERNLRPVVSRIDWREQRRLFQKITGSLNTRGLARNPRRPTVRRAKVRACKNKLRKNLPVGAGLINECGAPD